MPGRLMLTICLALCAASAASAAVNFDWTDIGDPVNAGRSPLWGSSPYSSPAHEGWHRVERKDARNHWTLEAAINI
jgi:hypothetical protein